MLYFTETSRSGSYPKGYPLFKSETNSVDVIFTSDYSGRKNGIMLDVKSISCGSDVEKIVVDAGEVFEGAIVTDVESDGKYPNRATQKWKIITDENQCIVISIGVGGFNTERYHDHVSFKDSNSRSSRRLTISLSK